MKVLQHTIYKYKVLVCYNASSAKQGKISPILFLFTEDSEQMIVPRIRSAFGC